MGPAVLASLQSSIATVDPGLPQVALPTGWDTSIDKARNKRYYYHRASGKRQWTSPVPTKQPPPSVGGPAELEHSMLQTPLPRHPVEQSPPPPPGHPASIPTSS